MHLAAYMGHSSEIEYLLQQGANIMTVDIDLSTALHRASAGSVATAIERLEVVKVLLEWKVDINACDKDGRTAYDIAGEGEIKKLLGEYTDRQILNCKK